jgi:hypothetical protein
MPKATELERKERILSIIKLRMEGVTARSAILQFYAKNYSIKTRQIDEDIKEAKKVIIAEMQGSLDEEIADAILRYKSLIQKNMKILDFREARNCQNDLSRLLGLEKAQKTETIYKKIGYGPDPSEE